MQNNKIIKGFSKLSKEAKIEWITKEYLNDDKEYVNLLKSYWHEDSEVQKSMTNLLKILLPIFTFLLE